jgi:hypothetical protein
MLEENWAKMRKNDWLKFVLYDVADMNEMLRWCEEHHETFKGHIAAGLFWGTSYLWYGKPDGTIEELLHAVLVEHPEYRIHLNFQAHKLISLYDQNIGLVQKTYVPKDL